MESIVEETKILLSVDDDLDGGAASLRTFLTSAGPDFPWRILKPDPSEGMGLSETISLVLESADATAATVERSYCLFEQSGHVVWLAGGLGED